MSIILGQRSLDRLNGVHPDLVRVVKKAAAISNLDFTILEGVRTISRQKELVKQGASKTMNSRHITGHAVDIAPMINGKISWDWPIYYRLAEIIKAAAASEKVPLQWGGDWRSFKDGPHWELPWKFYPKET